MERTERFHRIEQLLKSCRTVPLRAMVNDLEVSPATVKRDLEYLRNRLNVPIVWVRERRGYILDYEAPRSELPGLWFGSAEAHALLSMEHLLENLQPGLLTQHIDPLRKRIVALLEKGDHSAEEIRQRIRVLPMASRRVESKHFAAIAAALLQRKRLHITYQSRTRDEKTGREVSPQRLVHYRDNWYLDAWCHMRKELRSFAVDRIAFTKLLDKKARNVSERLLDKVLASGYGIISGQKTKTARLRFSAEVSRWVSDEQWHPRQKGWFEGERWLLELPYSGDTELLMDILRYGPDVAVVSPPELREKVVEKMRETLEMYENE
ncbi:MAG: WYL domain-containing protein [Nitrospirota bacterium]|nr:WYL domain-containing protein [Nitrospirota bacterium]